MKPLIIFGASDFAEVAHYYFTKDANKKIAAFAVDGSFIKEESFLNSPVVAFEELEKEFAPTNYDIFIAIAYRKLNQLRADKFFAAKEKGFTFASYVSSKLNCLEPPKVGENCFILEDNTIQPFTKIGDNTIMWSGNHLGHHSSIGNHCFISSHVCISGKVRINDYCFLGINSNVREGVTIAENCLIGAGCSILADTLPNQVYAEKGTQPRKVDSTSIDF
jgi:sugar O-acyltransferase (sialic acid O-acetyltransferase NeuD family)